MEVSHRSNCPTDYEARREAERNAERDHHYGWGRSYRSPYDCDEANRAYSREYEHEFQRLEEEAAQARRAEARRQAQREEEAYLEQQYHEQQQWEEELRLQQEAEERASRIEEK